MQVCDSLPSFSTLERLDILKSPQRWHEDMENPDRLENFHSFDYVKVLFLCDERVGCVITALQELTGELATEALPVLHRLILQGTQPF